MFSQTIGRQWPNYSTRKGLRLSSFFFLPLWIFAHPQTTPASGYQSPSVQSPQQQNAEPQNAREVTTLELDNPIERKLSAGQKHVYQIPLSEGQYVKVVIRQQGINVAVTLRVPGGETIQFIDVLIGPQERTIRQVAESPGIYQFDVSAGAKAPLGRYEIRVVELRPATENDRELQRARNLSFEQLRLHRQGRYLEARPFLIELLEVREKVLGPDDLLVATTLGNLAFNYFSTGDYASAEPLRLRQLKILEKVQGPDHPAVATVLNALGGLYLARGDYLKAEEIDLKALGIFERAQQAESNEVASLLDALGSIYYARGDHESAEKYYQRSRAVLEKIFGPDHFHLTGSFTFLGRVAYDVGDYAKAEAMFQRALNLSEKALGQDSLFVTGYRNDLATVYGTTGDYAKAEALYRQALSTHEQKAAMSSPVVQETLFGLARLDAARGRSSEALKFQSRASELEERYLGLNLAAGSEREKLTFLDQMSLHSSRHISLHTDLAPNDPAARDLALTTILRRKGRVQDALSENLAALRRRFVVEDQKLLDQLGEVTSKLANLVLNGPQKATPAEHQDQIKKLEEQRETLEGEISRRSAGFYRRAQPATLAAVQQAIPDGAALIEFAIYRPFDPKKPDNKTAYDEPRYVAYVVRRQGEVQWKELGEAKEIDGAISALRQALHDPKSKDARKLARALDERVMRPVRALLGDATHLLVSPDGELNLIPFEALVDEHDPGRYLIERYSFTYLTSGRDLLRMKARGLESKPPVVANPLVIADPSFNEPVAGQFAKTNALRKPTTQGGTRSVTNARDLSEVYFAPLGGTADEARTILKLFRESELLTGARATESALKRASAPRLLHVATHGFFLQDAETSAAGSAQMGNRGTGANARIENPLLRSGLALAGANLRGEAGGDDGILTALEASGLNLWGTKLAVLSACDTGLGEVRNGEGVYGLRRAFVLAGAESLVMSLWPVSDYPTKRLMTGYYENLRKGMGRGEALRRVQLDMLRKYHPFYWANFIQSGEWANLDGERLETQPTPSHARR